jgi:hypothetical protein
VVSVLVSFASVLDRSQPFRLHGSERDGRDDPPREHACDDLLSGRCRGASGTHEPRKHTKYVQDRARPRNAQDQRFDSDYAEPRQARTL